MSSRAPSAFSAGAEAGRGEYELLPGDAPSTAGVRSFRLFVREGAGLEQGLATIRAQAQARLARLGVAGLAAEIAARDPATFAALDPANPARLLRAWEVLAQTGAGLAAWRARAAPPLVPLTQAKAMVLAPDRARLYAACDARFDAMLAQGALDEAQAVAALPLPASAPALKALGARELMAHLRGDIPLETAAATVKQATRRYAKRQMTWFRNRMIAWRTIHAQQSCDFLDLATDYLREGP